MHQNTSWWIWAVVITLFSIATFVCSPPGERTTFRVTSHKVRVILPTDTAYLPIDTVSPAMNTVALQGLSLQQCVDQCSYRRKCRSVNYSKMYALCEVLEYRDDVVPVYAKRNSFVHISRDDIQVAQQIIDACNTCETGVCFPNNTTCSVLECPTFRVMAGQVTGNVQTVGSRALVQCYVNHVLIGSGTSVCDSNGSWVGFKSCWWNCLEPRGYRNALVEPGATTNGTVRTYNCVGDFFLSRRPNVTQKNVTCHYGGTWDPGPRCVKDCSEANNPRVHLAENVTGVGLEDFDARTYTCPQGRHVLNTWYHVEEWYTGEWEYINGSLANNRTVKCNGVGPNWVDIRFVCAKYCTGAPRDKHVASIFYSVTSNVTRANYTCLDWFSAFQGARKLDWSQPLTITCSDDDTAWQNANFHCELDCDAPPSVSNLGNVTYTFVTNLTTAHYACADGYKPWTGSEFVDHVVGTCNNIDRVWNYTDFSCAKDCENPPSLTNTGETTYVVEPDVTTAKYTCTEGYKAWTGSTFLNDVTGTCDTPDGNWNFTDFTCEKDCDNSPTSPNIKTITYTIQTENIVATYACAVGHVIWNGSDVTPMTEVTIACDTAGGNWSFVPFLCIKDCTDPHDVINVERVTYTDNTTHTFAEYACASGHVIYDGTRLTSDTRVIAVCSSPGDMWQFPDFVCARNCENPPSVTNTGETTYVVEPDVTRAKYTCAEGYKAWTGSTFLNDVTGTCDTPDGEWNFAEFTCEKDCDNPPTSPNIKTITYTIHPEKTVATYACAVGHVIWNGSEVTTMTEVTIACDTARGEWSFVPFLCIKDCTDPHDVINVERVTYTDNTTHTFAEYTCAAGHVIYDGTRLTSDTRAIAVCSSPGDVWQFPDFICARNCENPPSVTNTGETTYVVEPDVTRAKYTCAEGYKAWTGSTFLKDVTGTCDTPDGDWNFADFTCEKDCDNPPTSPNIKTITYTIHPEKTVATYACAVGHVIWNGSEVTTMTEVTIACDTAGGDWSFIPFLCIKDCTDQHDVINVERVTYTDNTTHTFAEYACAAGHAIYDGTRLTSDTRAIAVCSSPGDMWQFPDFVCARNCDNPPTSPNIKTITYTIHPEETVAIYACAVGHVIWNGSEVTTMTEVTIACDTAGGDWSFLPFLCIKDCTDQHDVINVELVTYTDNTTHTFAEYACAAGHVIYDGTRLTSDTRAIAVCSSPDDMWQFPDFMCARNCDNPPTSPNIKTITYSIHPEKTVATYACAVGHVIWNGSDVTTMAEITIACDTAGGDWSFVPFLCIKDCTDPHDVINVERVTYTDNTTHTFAEYACASGHVIYDGTRLTSDTRAIAVCSSPGDTWQFPDFMCARNCANPPSKDNVTRIDYNVTAILTVAQYTCHTDYVIQVGGIKTTDQSAIATCSEASGDWQNAEFACVQQINDFLDVI